MPLRNLLVVVAFCVVAASAASSFKERPAGLWPLPASVTGLKPSAPLSVNPAVFQSCRITEGGKVSEQGLLHRACLRYHEVVFGQHATDADAHKRSFRAATAGPQLTTLQLTVTEAAGTTPVIQFGTDESYELFVNDTNAVAEVRAKTIFGALRGLDTFSQLLYGSGLKGVSSGRRAAAAVAPAAGTILAQQAHVVDTPRFPWRGLLIDTSRHFLPVKTIKDIISGMPYNKMNTLHWHVVDGQSFPLVSTNPKSNRLSMGAYAPELVYQPADVIELVQYANDRGVRLLPEFDMPAHATAWGYGYPDLICPCQMFANECIPEPNAPHSYDDGCGDAPFNPVRASTYDLLTAFLGEMAGRFPDNFVHLGGDELQYREQCWNISEINTFMAKNNIKDYVAMEGYFIQKVQSIATANKKTVLHWQEIFNNHIDMPKDVIIHVWMDNVTLDSVVNAGYRGIMSYGWYLDHLDDGWDAMYLNEPVSSSLSPDAAARVLGGEACMWAEMVDENNIESRIWPRASAAAERLWSPRSVTDLNDAQRRLHDQRCRMLSRGNLVEPFQPGWCY